MSQARALQLTNLNVPVGSLDAYIHQIQQVPLLTLEQEQDYAKALNEDGDLDAARQLVLSHLRYVVRVARGYLGYGLPLGDLIQEGNVGLMKAVKRFDHTVGVRLVSFAVHWIKAEIHEYIIRNWRIVKVATTKAQRKLFFNLRSKKKRLGWASDAEVTAIAESLSVSKAEVWRMEQRLNATDSSFDLSDFDDDKAFAPVQYLEAESSDPALLFENQNQADAEQTNLTTALASLDARSRDILQSRWLTEKKQTLHDLADRYNVSAERIRQLEKSALIKLREQITAAGDL